MTKSEALADPNSCLNQSRDDEPIFVLCARDPCAADNVDEWARAYEEEKWSFDNTEAENNKIQSKAQTARNVAQQMRKWRRENILE